MSAVAVLALAGVACQRQPVVDVEAEKKAVLEMEAAWAKAGAAKDVDAFVSYYADDAVVLEPNKPTHQGKAAIRTALQELFAMPGMALSFQSTKVAVASSGDLAWSTGGYTMSFQGPKGAPMNDRGKFVTVYAKQPDGQWKTVADMFSSDLPPPAAPPEAKK
jgi:uncharacterized protein (TIGR02246 family)